MILDMRENLETSTLYLDKSETGEAGKGGAEALPPELAKIEKEVAPLADLYKALTGYYKDKDKQGALPPAEFLKMALQKDADNRLS